MWQMKTYMKIAATVGAFFLLLPLFKILVQRLNSAGFNIDFDYVYFAVLIFVAVFIGQLWNNRDRDRKNKAR